MDTNHSLINRSELESDFLGAGWSFPLRVQGEIVLISRDEANIQQSILIILGTRKGERVMRPDFGCGVHDLVFAPINMATVNMAAFYVKEALQQWEPRIAVDSVEAEIDSDVEARINIDVRYTILSANASANLVYPFYLETN